MKATLCDECSSFRFSRPKGTRALCPKAVHEQRQASQGTKYDRYINQSIINLHWVGFSQFLLSYRTLLVYHGPPTSNLVQYLWMIFGRHQASKTRLTFVSYFRQHGSSEPDPGAQQLVYRCCHLHRTLRSSPFRYLASCWLSLLPKEATSQYKPPSIWIGGLARL